MSLSTQKQSFSLLLVTALSLALTTAARAADGVEQAEDAWAEAQNQYYREARKLPNASNDQLEKLKQKILDPSRQALEQAYSGVRKSSELAMAFTGARPATAKDPSNSLTDSAPTPRDASPGFVLSGEGVKEEITYTKKSPPARTLSATKETESAETPAPPITTVGSDASVSELAFPVRAKKTR